MVGPDPKFNNDQILYSPLSPDLQHYYRLQCCGSGMFIPDPDFYPSRIPDPGSRIPDLGSRISDPGSRIPDLGSRISDPGSRIPDPKTGM